MAKIIRINIDKIVMFYLFLLLTSINVSCIKSHNSTYSMSGRWNVIDQRHSIGSIDGNTYTYHVTISNDPSNISNVYIGNFGNIPNCFASVTIDNSLDYLWLYTSSGIAHGHDFTFTGTGTPGEVNSNKTFFSLNYNLNENGLLFSGYIVATKIPN